MSTRQHIENEEDANCCARRPVSGIIVWMANDYAAQVNKLSCMDFQSQFQRRKDRLRWIVILMKEERNATHTTYSRFRG